MLLEQGFPFLKRTVFTQELPEHNLPHLCNVLSRLARTGSSGAAQEAVQGAGQGAAQPGRS